MSDRLAEWRDRVAPREIALSNGLTMLVRPVRLEDLITAGTVPLTLINRAQRIKTQKDGSYKDEDADALSKAVNAVVLAVAVDPRVTKDGAGDSIAVDDIPFLDRLDIFQEVNRPTAAVQSFPGEPNGSDALAPDGEDVQPAA